MRSGSAVQVLKKLGYDAHNIGTIRDWAAAGGADGGARGLSRALRDAGARPTAWTRAEPGPAARTGHRHRADETPRRRLVPRIPRFDRRS